MLPAWHEVTNEYSVTGELTGTEISENNDTSTQNNVYDSNGTRIVRTEGNDTERFFTDEGNILIEEGNSGSENT